MNQSGFISGHKREDLVEEQEIDDQMNSTEKRTKKVTKL